MIRRAQGFTLIELMIVIAILGILLAIAIPAYSDYTIRTKVAEGLLLATTAKTSVTETRQQTSQWPADNQTAGMANTITSTYVNSITVTGAGLVTVTFRNIDPTVDGQSLELEPTLNGAVVRWTCRPAGLPTRYLPAACRN